MRGVLDSCRTFFDAQSRWNNLATLDISHNFIRDLGDCSISAKGLARATHIELSHNLLTKGEASWNRYLFFYFFLFVVFLELKIKFKLS